MVWALKWNHRWLGFQAVRTQKSDSKSNVEIIFRLKDNVNSWLILTSFSFLLINFNAFWIDFDQFGFETQNQITLVLIKSSKISQIRSKKIQSIKNKISMSRLTVSRLTVSRLTVSRSAVSRWIYSDLNLECSPRPHSQKVYPRSRTEGI